MASAALVVLLITLVSVIYISTASATAISRTTSQVQLQVSQWEDSINNRSVGSITEFYTNSSVVSLYSKGIGNLCNQLVLNGTYTYAGTSNAPSIRGLYTTELSNFKPSPSLVTVSNLTLKDNGRGSVNATFTLVLNGIREVFGPTNETANVQQQWTNQGGSGSWQILKENWDYLSWYVQIPMC